MSVGIDDVLEGVPVESAERLEGYAKQIDVACGKTLAALLEIGDLLLKANTELANHHGGTFQKWVRQRLGITPWSANRYMQAAISIPPTSTRDTVSQHFDCGATYLLTAESTPEDALADAIAAAERGERITLAKAKEIAGNYRAASDDEPSEWELFPCVEQLRKYVCKMYERWPRSELEVLPGKLRSLADDIEAGDFENGDDE